MGGNNGTHAHAFDLDWARRLGEARHTRDDAAAHDARVKEEDAARQVADSTGRWAVIVAGIRRLADAYNAGAGRAVLTIVEQPGQVTIAVAPASSETASLTAALEGTLICLHCRDADGILRTSEVRMLDDRTDAATAAYLVQNWMQRL